MNTSMKRRLFANLSCHNIFRWVVACGSSFVGFCAADGANDLQSRTNILHPFQRFTLFPPKPPAEFNPDPGTLPVAQKLWAPGELRLKLESIISEPPPPLPPSQFNPDPGASTSTSTPCSRSRSTASATKRPANSRSVRGHEVVRTTTRNR